MVLAASLGFAQHDNSKGLCLVDGAAHLALAELEYDILETMRSQEIQKLPVKRLIESQFQVGWDIREYLLEFLMQAQQALDLRPESFVLGVSILDRYMSCRQVVGKHYQLVGCVCLWLAAKAQDDKTKVPTTRTLAYMCANAYTDDMFRDMEWHVLTSLDWDIQAPISFDFVDISVGEVARQLGEINFNADDYNICRTMARYVCECALFDKDGAVGYPPSVVSASAVALCVLIQDVLGNRNWQPVFPTGTIKECFDTLVAVTSSPPAEAAARYSTQITGNVATFVAEFFQLMQQESTCLTTSKFMAATSAAPVAGLQTPVRQRTREYSIESITPASECGFETPQSTASSSPQSVAFMPLTPNDAYLSYSGAYSSGQEAAAYPYAQGKKTMMSAFPQHYDQDTEMYVGDI